MSNSGDPSPIICVAGPTASGKSRRAIELAKELGGEVISVDSRQVYRMLDIGTEKTTKEEMEGIPHHLIDIVDPAFVGIHRIHADGNHFYAPFFELRRDFGHGSQLRRTNRGVVLGM